MPMSRAAAEIDPVSRMLSSSFALPGPMRAPDSKTMLTLTPAIEAFCHAQSPSRHSREPTLYLIIYCAASCPHVTSFRRRRGRRDHGAPKGSTAARIAKNRLPPRAVRISAMYTDVLLFIDGQWTKAAG